MMFQLNDFNDFLIMLIKGLSLILLIMQAIKFKMSPNKYHIIKIVIYLILILSVDKIIGLVALLKDKM